MMQAAVSPWASTKRIPADSAGADLLQVGSAAGHSEQAVDPGTGQFVDQVTGEVGVPSGQSSSSVVMKRISASPAFSKSWIIGFSAVLS